MLPDIGIYLTRTQQGNIPVTHPKINMNAKFKLMSLYGDKLPVAFEIDNVHLQHGRLTALTVSGNVALIHCTADQVQAGGTVVAWETTVRQIVAPVVVITRNSRVNSVVASQLFISETSKKECQISPGANVLTIPNELTML